MTTPATRQAEWVAEPLTEPGFYGNVPHDAYHGDPCATPSLSSSIAKTLLDRSPLHAWHEHPRLGGGGRRRSSDAMDTGSIIHALVLGGGEAVHEIAADDYRTKWAKDQRDYAREAGKIPVLAERLERCREAACRLGYLIPEDAQREVTVVWRSEGGVLCRGRKDAFVVSPSSGLIIDLKTTEDARRASEGRAILNLGREIQAAAYLEAAATLLPELAGRLTYRLLFAEVEEPFDVVPAELDGQLLELGQRKWRRAVESWGECLATGEWPGAADGRLLRVECPPWAMENDLASQLMGSNDESLGG